MRLTSCRCAAARSPGQALLAAAAGGARSSNMQSATCHL
jgi:hypothetical protein